MKRPRCFTAWTPDEHDVQASADLAADIYLHRPDGYHFVQAAGSRASDRGLETTHFHAEHLAQLLAECLSQLQTADWAAAEVRPALPLAALVADVPAALAGGGRRGPVPAILREVPRRGAYRSFAQFLANRPDTALAMRLDTLRPHYKSKQTALKWAGVAQLRPRVTDGAGHRVSPVDVWGFSDGQQLFVLHNKRFFPLTRQGNAFTFVGEAPVDQEYVRAATETQARAGLIGVALMGMPDHTAEPMAYALDLRTGGLSPYPSPGVAVRPDSAFIYIYRPTQAAGSAPVKVSVNGRAMGSLGPGQYLEVPWGHFGQQLRLCLEGLAVGKPCQYLVPNTAQLNYLRINPASATAPPWQWVPPAQGAADLDELDKQAK